jgi:hypothetical protein
MQMTDKPKAIIDQVLEGVDVPESVSNFFSFDSRSSDVTEALSGGVYGGLAGMAYNTVLGDNRSVGNTMDNGFVGTAAGAVTKYFTGSDTLSAVAGAAASYALGEFDESQKDEYAAIKTEQAAAPAAVEENREYASAFLAGAVGGILQTYMNGGGDIGDYARNAAAGGAAGIATESAFGNTSFMVEMGIGAATPWLLEKAGVFNPTSGNTDGLARDAQAAIGPEETGLLSRLFSPSNTNDSPAEPVETKQLLRTAPNTGMTA